MSSHGDVSYVKHVWGWGCGTGNAPIGFEALRTVTWLLPQLLLAAPSLDALRSETVVGVQKMDTYWRWFEMFGRLWKSQNTAEAIPDASGGCSSPAGEAPPGISGGTYTKEAGTGIMETDDLVKFAGKRYPWTLLAICVRGRKISRKKHTGF